MAEAVTLKTIREACADALGLLLQVSVTAKVDSDTYTIPLLADVSPDPERMRDSFLMGAQTTGPQGTPIEFRRILNFGWPTNSNVDISRAYTLGPQVGDLLPPASMQIYFMLTPDEWNNIINQDLPQFYYIDRVSVTPVANTLEYTLAGSTWLQTRGQVINVFYENTTTKTPTACGTYTLTEAANVLKLVLHEYPPDAAMYNIIVEARHNYSPLASDVATTTCPHDLWFHAGQVGALHRIFQKYGSNIKRLFGQSVIIAERELAAAKVRCLPALVTRELAIDFAWSGPDNDYFPETQAW